MFFLKALACGAAVAAYLGVVLSIRELQKDVDELKKENKKEGV